MSKSRLRNKYMRSLYKGHSLFTSKMNDPVRNPHRQDEMPSEERPSQGKRYCACRAQERDAQTNSGATPGGWKRRGRLIVLSAIC